MLTAALARTSGKDDGDRSLITRCLGRDVKMLGKGNVCRVDQTMAKGLAKDQLRSPLDCRR